MSIGAHLKSLREKLGLTITQAAERSGLHFTAVVGLESDLGSFRSLKALAGAYGKTVHLSVTKARNRKETLQALAERSGLSQPTCREVLALIQAPGIDLNPKVASVETLVGALGGKILIH